MTEPEQIENRFTKTSACIQQVRSEVWTLEEWLSVHPFPKYKSGSKYINEL